MRFQAPQLGALGVTFTAFRAMQFASLIAIIGLTANFVNEIVSSQREAPDVFIGTLVVTSISSLYVAISYILYYDGLLPLLVAGGMDMCLLVGAIVVAVTIGKPLSMLTCDVLPEPTPPTETFTVSISTRSALSKYNTYLALITTDKPHCYEVKAIWGLAIALCVLFAFSGLICVGLWHRVRRATAPPKDIEGPTALGTRLLSPGPGSRFPPPFAAPKASHRRPVPRLITDDDDDRMPIPQIMINNANTGPTIVVGRSLTDQVSPPPPPPQPPLAVAPPAAAAAASPRISSPIAREMIPIFHDTDEEFPIRPRVVSLKPIIIMPPIPPSPSDDGFTPVTPITPSPAFKDHRRLSRAAQLVPRDALGIPVSKFKRAMSSSRKAAKDELEDDTTPLSPALAAGEKDDVEAPRAAKPKRKTFFGVLEGWWDLGLLERGKSLRRRG